MFGKVGWVERLSFHPPTGIHALQNVNRFCKSDLHFGKAKLSLFIKIIDF